jgi:hypothetical protein
LLIHFTRHHYCSSSPLSFPFSHLGSRNTPCRTIARTKAGSVVSISPPPTAPLPTFSFVRDRESPFFFFVCVFLCGISVVNSLCCVCVFLCVVSLCGGAVRGHPLFYCLRSRRKISLFLLLSLSFRDSYTRFAGAHEKKKKKKKKKEKEKKTKNHRKYERLFLFCVVALFVRSFGNDEDEEDETRARTTRKRSRRKYYYQCISSSSASSSPTTSSSLHKGIIIDE